MTVMDINETGSELRLRFSSERSISEPKELRNISAGA
jgi:hypothetical protein